MPFCKGEVEMKVRDLVKALNMLDQDREIEIAMLQVNLNTHCFRSGCAIHEEYPTGNYVVLPNNSDRAEVK